MHFRTRRIIASVAVIGAVAAGGAAYTAGSGFGSQPAASYAGTVIEGANATALQFQYSNDGSVITQADLFLAGDYSSASSNQGAPYTIKAGFGAAPGAGNSLSPSDLTSTCTATAFSTEEDPATLPNSSVTVPEGDTGVTCPFDQTVSNSIDEVSDAGADQFDLLVTSTNPTS